MYLNYWSVIQTSSYVVKFSVKMFNESKVFDNRNFEGLKFVYELNKWT